MFINPNWDQRLPPCLTAASVTLRHLSQSALLLWKIPLIQHTKPEPRLLFLSHLSSLTSAQPAAHPFQPYLHLCKTFWHSYPVRPPLADHVLSCSCSCLPACLPCPLYWLPGTDLIWFQPRQSTWFLSADYVIRPRHRAWAMGPSATSFFHFHFWSVFEFTPRGLIFSFPSNYVAYFCY